MNTELINAYLDSARVIIGERARDEIAYDDAVIANLSAGMNIRKSITSANKEHPNEAIKSNADQLGKLKAHYQFLSELKAIIERFGIKE